MSTFLIFRMIEHRCRSPWTPTHHCRGQPHIFRVSNRSKLAMRKNIDQVEQKLLKVVPAEFKVDVHHWLHDHRVRSPWTPTHHCRGQPHIFRVSNRTKLAMGKNVDQIEQELLKVVLAEFKVDVHHWLILHGRYICVARKPRCGACVIEDLCEFKDKTV